MAPRIVIVLFALSVLLAVGWLVASAFIPVTPTQVPVIDLDSPATERDGTQEDESTGGPADQDSGGDDGVSGDDTAGTSQDDSSDGDPAGAADDPGGDDGPGAGGDGGEDSGGVGDDDGDAGAGADEGPVDDEEAGG